MPPSGWSVKGRKRSNTKYNSLRRTNIMKRTKYFRQNRENSGVAFGSASTKQGGWAQIAPLGMYRIVHNSIVRMVPSNPGAEGPRHTHGPSAGGSTKGGGRVCADRGTLGYEGHSARLAAGGLARPVAGCGLRGGGRGEPRFATDSQRANLAILCRRLTETSRIKLQVRD